MPLLEELVVVIDLGESGGSPPPWEEIRGILCNFARILRIPPDDCEDTVQQVLLELSTKPAENIAGRDRIVLGKTILGRRNIDRIRKLQRAPPHVPLEVEPMTPESTEIDDEEVQALRDAFATLNELEQLVVNYVYFDDWKLVEIAKALHLTPNHVRVAHSRAKDKIRAKLKPR